MTCGVLVDVVVVEEQHEQAHVVARGFDAGVRRRADVDRLAQIGWRLAAEADELRGFDGLQDPVLLDLEVRGLQVVHRLAVAIRDRDVDAHEVDLGAEDGLLLGRVGGLLRILRRLGAHPRRDQRTECDGAEHDERRANGSGHGLCHIGRRFPLYLLPRRGQPSRYPAAGSASVARSSLPVNASDSEFTQ